MYDADTCPGEYVDAGFQNKNTQHQLGVFVLYTTEMIFLTFPCSQTKLRAAQPNGGTTRLLQIAARFGGPAKSILVGLVCDLTS